MQGDKYLKIFINDILEIDDFDFTVAKVDRERSIDNLGRMPDWQERKKILDEEIVRDL